jgi:hypothetical protein
MRPGWSMRRMYLREFREHVVELVRVGRAPESLAKEFEPSAQTIPQLGEAASLDGGRRTDGLTQRQKGWCPL